ncbi:MAG: ATP-binding protein [Bacteroidetes bacterium]|nr:ATP-binding protein [Bacteroidota bacterium]
MSSSGREQDASPDRCRFQLILTSAPHEIQRVEKFLTKANATIGLDDGTMYRVLVAATEAVNNAILHGNHSDPSKEVRLCVRTTKRFLTIRVDDEGQGFDASSLPNPLDDENLLKEHGRGVFLIRSLMDDLKFLRFKKGSAIVMKVRLDRLR